MRGGWTSTILIAAVASGMLASVGPTAAQERAPEWSVAPGLPAEAREFDFWVGEWEVNLRMRQEDGSWLDQIRAEAHVYPILRGKAILELWSDERETGLKGYSLRYFDTAREEWVIWLNWPGPNRSGSSSLAGTFRHGRGEFFSPGDDGRITRYTFSDIGPDSFRWDDALSTDDGASWAGNWIMEFSRAGDRAFLAADSVLTFHDGGRCDASAFRSYEFLEGRMTGTVEVPGPADLVIQGHRILDGCSVMTFAGPDGAPENAFAFSHLTWNTSAERFELTTLTSGASTPVRTFFGQPGSHELVLTERVDGPDPVDRFRIEENPDGSVTWVHEAPEGSGWRPVWRATVAPPEAR